MARPRTIEDEDLLESIRATFLELGPSAPTNELAARASVSEGTLFKRFGNKRAMFVRAMEPPALEGPWYDDMQGLAALSSSTPHRPARKSPSHPHHTTLHRRTGTSSARPRP